MMGIVGMQNEMGDAWFGPFRDAIDRHIATNHKVFVSIQYFF